MRFLLSITLALSLATIGGGCSKKKAATTPTNTATEPAGGSGESHEEKDMKAPDEGSEDSHDMKSSDPCEGGE